jgi:hypothetical protein
MIAVFFYNKIYFTKNKFYTPASCPDMKIFFRMIIVFMNNLLMKNLLA